MSLAAALLRILAYGSVGAQSSPVSRQPVLTPAEAISPDSTSKSPAAK
jgi:hypothetical protein